MRYLAIFLCGLFLCSCEDFFMQELTDYDNDFVPQLALLTLLQPSDSLIVVDVRRNISALGGDPTTEGYRSVPAGATVSISDGTTTVPLAYRRFPTEGYLALVDTLPPDFIRPGGLYQLEASFDGLQAGGSILIPTDSVDRSAVGFAIDEVTEDGFAEVFLSFSTPNVPGEDDHYVVIVDRSSAPSYSRRKREIHEVRWGRESFGERLTFRPVSLFENNRTVVQICAADAATYEYLSTRATAIGNQENPFAEPVLIPSNVEGGIGHVGGLNCQRFAIRR